MARVLVTLVDVRAPSAIDCETLPTLAFEAPYRVDTDLFTAAAVVVALVDVHATEPVGGQFVAPVAGATETAGGVNALLVAACVVVVTFVDVDAFPVVGG